MSDTEAHTDAREVQNELTVEGSDANSVTASRAPDTEVQSDPERHDPVTEQVRASFESARQQLVGTELSSPLLNFRYSSAKKGMQVVDERSDALYKLLIQERAEMRFEESRSGEDEFNPELPPVPRERTRGSDRIRKHHLDKVLQTSHPPQNLQYRLLNTERDARLYQEERGANSLFLSLGMLHWRDEATGEKLRSPLLLLPVELYRKEASKKFRVRYNGQDVEENLALRKRLEEQLGVKLPDITTSDTLEPSEYFRQVESSLQSAGITADLFSISPNEMTVGLFSFGSYLMYRDLDESNWPAGHKPFQHAFVRTLFDGGFVDAGPVLSPEKRVADQIDLADRCYVLDTDSSQLRALEEVRAGKSIRIQGPPGTGKTTTIVNLASDAVSQGKKVLIVSEKLDALRVAKSWFAAAGIGDLVLSLDAQANRKSVRKELSKTLKIGKPKSIDVSEVFGQYEKARRRLNSHVDALSAGVGNSGRTTYEVLSELAALEQQDSAHIELYHPEMGHWTRDQYERALALSHELEQHYLEHGMPAKHPHFGTNLLPGSGIDLEELDHATHQAHRAARMYREKLEELCMALGLDSAASEENIDQLLHALSAINDLETDNGRLLDGIYLGNSIWTSPAAELEGALWNERKFAELLERETGAINSEVLAAANLDSIQDAIRNHQAKTLRWFDRDYQEAKRELSEITSPPKELSSQLELVAHLRVLQELQETIRRQALLWEDALGSGVKGDREQFTPLRYWQRNSQLAHGIHDFAMATSDHPESERLIELLYRPGPVYKQEKLINDVIELQVKFRKRRDDVMDLLQFREEMAQQRFFSQNVVSQEQVLADMRFGMQSLDAMLAYNDIVRRSEPHALSFIASKTSDCPAAATGLTNSLKRSWLTELQKSLLQSTPLMAQFHPGRHEEIIARFRKANEELLAANATRLSGVHWEQVPRMNSGGQAAILHHEVGKKGGHLPSRQLIAKAGNAIQAAKPIFMMSPQTVARDLPPGAVEFDLVIIDEGSQVQPVSALGAILRGDQVVVVGDNQQLDPTTFFESGSRFSYGVNEDEELEMENILDLTEEARLPLHSLKWHYRSRRPGLISVSNDEFYDGSLVVFPSAERGQEASGLVWNHISHGVYEPRTKRINEAEAAAVAHAVMDHALRRPEESLGVVTLNRPQMEAVTFELERLRQRHPELEEFFKRHGAEPFFIKNLETAQGIERDRIFISIGYARTKDGSLSLNFGPLNAKRGANRLNVLATRAKQACEIFTSLEPDEPEFRRSDSRAIRVLNRLMRQARDGMVESSEEEHEYELDPLQESVKQELEESGYAVHSQIGAFGSGVELAVVHPDDPTRYILGVQFDGAQYQAVASAGDRDKILHQALSYRGWELHRVWSIAARGDFAGEIKRIKDRIEQIQEREEGNGRERTVTHGRTERKIKRRKLNDSDTSLNVPYRKAVVSFPDLKREFAGEHSHSLANSFSEALRQVVAQEGPVHREIAYRRVRDGLGLSRMTERLKHALVEGETAGVSEGNFVVRDGFFYPSEESALQIRSRSKERGTVRKLHTLPPEEIELAIYQVVKHSYGITRTEIGPACFRLLGYRTPPKGGSIVISGYLDELLSQRVLRSENGYIRVGMAHNEYDAL